MTRNPRRWTGLEAATLPDAASRAGLAEAKAKKYADLLAREGRVVRLGEFVYDAAALEGLKARLRDRKATDPTLDVAAFRDLTGVLSRKYTIPLLEWLDREHVTRRVGDKRGIL